MGLFDDLFGEFFDFDGDGETSFDEAWIAKNILEDIEKDDDDLLDDDSDEDDEDDEDDEPEEWDDTEDSIIENEDESIPAEESEPAPLAAEEAEDDEAELREEDFPNRRRFLAADCLSEEGRAFCDAAYRRRETERCHFILDNAELLTAANYLSHDGEFLYAQAVQDHFALPVHLPAEDERREYEFEDMIGKIAKKDIPLSFAVWEWCLNQFLPFAQYDENAANDMTTAVLNQLYHYPKHYAAELARYMDAHPDFRAKIVNGSAELSDGLAEVIVQAIRANYSETAVALFRDGLLQANGAWKPIVELTKEVLFECETGEELECAEFFRDTLLPIVGTLNIGMVQDEIEEWEAEIAAYIYDMEGECEQYAFTRRNAWRKTAPDGKEFGLDPRDYDTEQEYLEELQEEKYGCREDYEDEELFGLCIKDYETEKAFRAALKRAEAEGDAMETVQHTEEMQTDTAIYRYCGVLFEKARRVYAYRTEDESITIGDVVRVPVENTDEAAEATVVSVGQYTRRSAPYPPEKTQFIIEKVSKQSR